MKLKLLNDSTQRGTLQDNDTFNEIRIYTFTFKFNLFCFYNDILDFSFCGTKKYYPLKDLLN